MEMMYFMMSSLIACQIVLRSGNLLKWIAKIYNFGVDQYGLVLLGARGCCLSASGKNLLFRLTSVTSIMEHP
jgi:hypothetical protein